MAFTLDLHFDPATGVDINAQSPNMSDQSTGPMQSNASDADDVGDVYRIEVRGKMPGGVATSNSFHYRLERDPPVNTSAEQWLADLVINDPFSPLRRWLTFCSKKWEVTCAVVYNVSDDKPFPFVLTVDGLEGSQDDEMVSSQYAVPIVFQAESDEDKIRHTKYLPGLSANAASRGSMKIGTYNAAKSLYGLFRALGGNGGGLQNIAFRSVVRFKDGDWKNANGFYFPLYNTRIKGRKATTC